MRHACGLLVLLLAILANGSPEWRTVSGRVVDTAGKPVASARIEHGDRRASHSTDVDGHFELTTEAPAVVIRKIGYQSAFLRTDNAEKVRIVLEPARSMTVCKEQFAPKTEQHTCEDFDNLATSYTLTTKDGTAAVGCGRGPFWTFGIPEDALVWNSVEYSESMTGDRAGNVDARGRSRDGTYWRYRGTVGESCIYSKVKQAMVADMDCVMEKPSQK
jgi:hypothetical protein